MAKLHIVYDPQEKVVVDAASIKRFNIRTASLDIPNDLLPVDVASISRKLADLLLAQLHND